MKKYNQLIKHSGNAALFDFIELSILGTLVAQPCIYMQKVYAEQGKPQ